MLRYPATSPALVFAHHPGTLICQGFSRAGVLKTFIATRLGLLFLGGGGKVEKLCTTSKDTRVQQI